MKKSNKLILSSSISNLLGTIVGKVLATIIAVILIRFLSVADYGQFNLFIGFVTFMGAFSLGINNVFQRFFPMYIKNDKQKAIDLFITLFLLRSFIFISVLLVFNIFSYFGFQFSKFHFPYFYFSLFISYIFSGKVFLTLALNNAYFDHKFVNIAVVSGDIVKVLFLIFSHDINVFYAIIVWAIGEAFVLLLIFLRFLKNLRPNCRELLIFHLKKLEFGRYIKYGRPMVFATTASYILSTQIDYYFLSYYFDNEIVGFYAFSAKIPFMMVTLAPSNSMFNILAPFLFNKIDEGKEIKETLSILHTFLKVNILIWSILSSLTLINIEIIINKIFGPEYIKTIPLIYVWFIVLYAQLIKNVFEPVARAIEFTNVYYFTFLAAILNIILNFLFIPTYGINGAILSTSISMLSQSLFISFFVAKKIGLLIHLGTVCIIFLRVFSVILFVIISKIVFSNTIFHFILSNVLLFIFLIICFGVMNFFSKDEIMYLRSFIPGNKI